MQMIPCSLRHAVLIITENIYTCSSVIYAMNNIVIWNRGKPSTSFYFTGIHPGLLFYWYTPCSIILLVTPCFIILLVYTLFYYFTGIHPVLLFYWYTPFYYFTGIHPALLFYWLHPVLLFYWYTPCFIILLVYTLFYYFTGIHRFIILLVYTLFYYFTGIHPVLLFYWFTPRFIMLLVYTLFYKPQEHALRESHAAFFRTELSGQRARQVPFTGSRLAWAWDRTPRDNSVPKK